MIKKCDICGSNLDPDAHFCGGCNVDLKESKEEESMYVNLEQPQPGKKKNKSSPKQETSENEKVMNWCEIQALCNSFEISFPHFFYLVIILAKGDTKIGFCNCTICNQGYRELLASTINTTEKKKLTAQSREIVIKARGDKIEGIKFAIPDFVAAITKKGTDHTTPEKEDPKPQQTNNGKIVIEIDPVVLEAVVLSTLSSEKGQEIIRSISKRKSKKEKIAT